MTRPKPVNTKLAFGRHCQAPRFEIAANLWREREHRIAGTEMKQLCAGF